MQHWLTDSAGSSITLSSVKCLPHKRTGGKAEKGEKSQSPNTGGEKDNLQTLEGEKDNLQTHDGEKSQVGVNEIRVYEMCV